MSAMGMSVRLDVGLDEALQRTRTALADQGFGILTETTWPPRCRPSWASRWHPR